MKYEIRRAVPADEDIIMSFREKVYPPGHKSLSREYWRWKFLKHPWVKEIPFYILISNDKVVGTQGYWPVKINCHGQLIGCAQLIDFRVLDEFKGLPAVKLYKATCLANGVNFGSSISEDARRFFKSAKWVDLSEQVGEFYYLLKISEIESSIINKIKFAIRLIEKKIKIRSIVKIKGDSCQSIISDCPPPGLESLLNGTNDLSKCHTVKDAAWVNWRYDQCPICQYQYASLYDGDCLKASLVFRVHSSAPRKIFQIVDLMYLADDMVSFAYLVADCIHFCQAQNLCAIETKLTGNAQDLFTKIGFQRGELSLGLMIHAKDKKLFDSLRQPGVFPFIIGDSDLW